MTKAGGEIQIPVQSSFERVRICILVLINMARESCKLHKAVAIRFEVVGSLVRVP